MAIIDRLARLGFLMAGVALYTALWVLGLFAFRGRRARHYPFL